MDTQAIDSSGNPTAPIRPKSEPIASSSHTAAKASSASTADTVKLSQEAQSIVRRDGAAANTTNYTGGEQKKISLSDNNDVVIEIIDPQTQEVVRTVPSEEQLELKKAIRNELDKI
jgi:uncharacterized FlaG/YvyC family protein